MSVRIIVCQTVRYGASTTCCAARGAGPLMEALRRRLIVEGLDDACSVREGPCLNHCTQGPNLRIIGRDFFTGMGPDTLDPVIAAVRRIIAEQE